MTKNLKDIPKEYTSKDGLLYKSVLMLSVFSGDCLARDYGFMYAEQLVKALKEQQDSNKE